MKQGKFILTSLVYYPVSILDKIKIKVNMRTDKGFKVNSGESRFGEHFKMKGVTLNILDVKISTKDSNGD